MANKTHETPRVRTARRVLHNAEAIVRDVERRVCTGKRVTAEEIKEAEANVHAAARELQVAEREQSLIRQLEGSQHGLGGMRYRAVQAIKDCGVSTYINLSTVWAVSDYFDRYTRIEADATDWLTCRDLKPKVRARYEATRGNANEVLRHLEPLKNRLELIERIEAQLAELRGEQLAA